jgi:hypothetical protein
MTSPSYGYNASASGLGGVIRQGKRTTIIPTVASVCLASAGGEASNSYDYYDRDGISFTRAQTRVGGYSARRNGSTRHSTFAEVLLLNLRVFDRLSIARMQAVVTSTRDIMDERDPKKHLQPDQTRFSVRLMYHGVEIDGEEVDPEIDTELCEAASYEKFSELLRGRRDKFSDAGKKLLDAHFEVQRTSPAPMAGPLVGFPGNANAEANRLRIPGFGNARFGSIIVKQDRQRVGLLRINLDKVWSPIRRRVISASTALAANDGITVQEDPPEDGGSVTSGDTGSNGVPIWDQG